MSAPAVDRTHPAPTRQPDTRVPRRSAGVPAARDAGGAIGRAYARRAVREKRLAGEQSGSTGRSQFVLLIMVLLGSGLVASLWLSTTAAADSYRLDAARQATRDLSERSESLRTEIASMQAAPSLAQAAERMGMVQVSDVARLVVAPDGSVQVVGTPKAAVAPPPPAPPVPVPPAQAQPAQQPQPAPAQPAPATEGQSQDARQAQPGQGTQGQPDQAAQAQPTQAGQAQAGQAQAGQAQAGQAQAAAPAPAASPGPSGH